MTKREYFTEEHICGNLTDFNLRVIKNYSIAGHTNKNWWLYNREYDDMRQEAEWYPLGAISYCPCCGKRLPK